MGFTFRLFWLDVFSISIGKQESFPPKQRLQSSLNLRDKESEEMVRSSCEPSESWAPWAMLAAGLWSAWKLCGAELNMEMTKWDTARINIKACMAAQEPESILQELWAVAASRRNNLGFLRSENRPHSLWMQADHPPQHAAGWPNCHTMGTKAGIMLLFFVKPCAGGGEGPTASITHPLFCALSFLPSLAFSSYPEEKTATCVS